MDEAFVKVLREYGAMKNANERKIIEYYRNLLEDKTEEIENLLNIAKINVHQGEIHLESIEDTLTEILKENPMLTVALSKLIMNVYLLTVCSNTELLSPDSIEFEVSEIQDALQVINSICTGYLQEN